VNTDVVTIAIDGQERIYINDIPLVNTQLATVREALRRNIEGINEPAVIISADAEATHQSVIKVLDAARQLSLTRITFSTQVYEEE
jgi:biopolymer transport protein ExbD